MHHKHYLQNHKAAWSCVFHWQATRLHPLLTMIRHLQTTAHPDLVDWRHKRDTFCHVSASEAALMNSSDVPGSRTLDHRSSIPWNFPPDVNIQQMHYALFYITDIMTILCLLAELHKNYSNNCHKIRWKGGTWVAEKQADFWWLGYN